MVTSQCCRVLLGVLLLVSVGTWLLLLDEGWWRSSIDRCTLPAEQMMSPGRTETQLLQRSEYGQRYLLLGYMRSGSSFTSELLSLNRNFNYIFEPLWIFKEARIDWNKTDEAGSVTRLLNQLYACDPTILSFVMLHDFVDRVRFNISSCEQNPLLIKTIRSHGPVLQQLLEDNPDTKVIHLVRDPRAIYTSRSDVKMQHESMIFCEQMRADLAVAETMMKNDEERWRNRYIRVKYEYLADPSTLYFTLKRLYAFMGVPLRKKLLNQYQQRHYTITDQKQKPYTTVRKQSYDPNHWKYTLDKMDIREIEIHCADVMRTLEYERYSDVHERNSSTVNDGGSRTHLPTQTPQDRQPRKRDITEPVGHSQIDAGLAEEHVTERTDHIIHHRRNRSTTVHGIVHGHGA